jgi:hypothetical protein
MSLHDGPEPLRLGPFETTFTIPRRLLRPGDYWIALGGSRHGGADWTWAADLACVEVMERWSPDYDKDDLGLVNVVGGAVRTTDNDAARLVASGGRR